MLGRKENLVRQRHEELKPSVLACFLAGILKVSVIYRM